MNNKQSLDLDVSPWQIKLDTWLDSCSITHTNKQFKLKNKAKFGRKLNNISKGHQLVSLTTDKVENNNSIENPEQARKQQSQSMIKNLKPRLKTINSDQGSHLIQTLSLKQIVPSSTKCSKKQTSRQERIQSQPIQQKHSARKQLSPDKQKQIQKYYSIQADNSIQHWKQTPSLLNLNKDSKNSKSNIFHDIRWKRVHLQQRKLAQQSKYNLRQKLIQQLTPQKSRSKQKLKWKQGSQIFQNKQLLLNMKSLQKFKSNKKLILPKIQLCAI